MNRKYITTSLICGILFVNATFNSCNIDTNKGLKRTLLPTPEEELLNSELTIEDRNVFYVWISNDNSVTIGNPNSKKQIDDISEITEAAKKFIKNEQNDPNLPEVSYMDIEGLGKTRVSTKHIICVHTNENTSYDTYFKVQEALSHAYDDLRNELAEEKFNCHFNECTNIQQEAIRKAIPNKISEKWDQL